MNTLHYFASTEAGGGDLFSSLGLDWQLFVLQMVAFVVLLLVLKKWVYPPLLDMLDQRDAKIRDGLKAAEKAQKAADETEERTAAMLKKARHESQEIVTAAKTEAASMVNDAKDDAHAQAERILASARTQTQTELAEAKRALRREMVDMVVEATRAVTAETVDASKDRQLIEKHLTKLDKEQR